MRSFRRLTIRGDFLLKLFDFVEVWAPYPPSAPNCQSEALEESARVGAQIQHKTTLVIEHKIVILKESQLPKFLRRDKEYF